MRKALGFICVLALGLMGCSETSGDGGSGGSAGMGGNGGSAITPGLWVGGDPASNTAGSPFDTGWAICFNVNEDGTALTPSDDCDIDGQNEGETWAIEVSWKDDVGRDPTADEECSATGTFDETVAIEDSAFEIFTHDFVRVVGSFDGETATGTATFDFHPGMGAGMECELVGEWTASPVVTDCAGVEDLTECNVGGNEGMCIEDGCVPVDCDGLENGTECLFVTPRENAGAGFCEAGTCVPPVEDCTGEEDGTRCATGWPMDLGLCVGGSCEPAVEDCAGREDGTPCWLDEDRSGIAFCEAGVCGAAPEIHFVMWRWLDDPCDANASGQSLSVLVAATDEDTPMEQLTYSGTVQDCAPDINAMESTLSCDVYLGARQSEAIVTDSGGNATGEFFAPDPCTNGCVGDCPK